MHTIDSLAHRSRLPWPVLAKPALPVPADWDPWNMLPVQFFSPRIGFYTGRPEAALLQAVLEDALVCFQRQFVTEGRRVQREAREAEAWFLSDDARWPFSFVTVCAVLGLEPESIRRRLKHWSCSHSVTPQRKKQHVMAVRQPPRFAA